MSDRAPHRSPEFIKFWVGQSVSLVGSEVSQLAMPLLAVLSLGASPGEMGVLRAVTFAPICCRCRSACSSIAPAADRC